MVSQANVSSEQIDTGIIVAVVSGIVATLTVFITGLWQWISGKKKTSNDAQVSLVEGFVALLAEFKNERILLVARIIELEKANHQQDRHIAKLERIMRRHKIEIIGDEIP